MQQSHYRDHMDARGPIRRPAPQRPGRQQMPEWAQIALVFAGAFIGGFVVWPIIRPMFVPTQAQHYASPQQYGAGYGPSDRRRAGR